MITTNNLTLRRLTLADAPFIFQLLNTPTWLQFIGDRNIKTLQDAEGYILRMQQNFYDKYGFGLLLVSLKANDESIGLCGLLKRDYLDGPDIGFAFLPDHEGKGYGFESSMAILENYQCDKLYAITSLENIRSQRLIERCGLAYLRNIETPEGQTLMLYQINS